MREWARRLRDRGIVANAMHPGWADTPGFAEALPTFHDFLGPYARTVEEGVDTAIWLAASADAGRQTGRLFLDRRPRPFDRVPWTRVLAADRRATVGSGRRADRRPCDGKDRTVRCRRALFLLTRPSGRAEVEGE